MVLEALPRSDHGLAGRRALDEAARVRLGTNPETAPDILRELATDPVVTVRAAVAMNAATPGQVDTLLAQDRDERVRTLLARKLASLIPAVPPPEREEMRLQAMSTLGKLVADEAIRVRAAIADVVKDMPQAPHALILRLAHDSAIAVCDPVIRLSPILSAQDLLALLAAPPSPGTLMAVARRAGLSEAISDVIAGGPDTAAITALLANPSAAIREATLDTLIVRAGDTQEWQAPLVRRPQLSTRAARALSDIVATQLLDELCSRADLAPAVVTELRTRLSVRLQADGRPARPEPTIEEAMAEARHLFAENQLDEDTLIAAAQRGEARRTTALLAVAADMASSVVDRAATLRSAKGLVSLVWKSGFTMRAAIPVQTLLARLSPAATLRETATGSFPLAIEEMRWQIDFLSRMGR